MSVSPAAELLRYRQTRIDSVGRKENIPYASVHRFTNIFITESRRFMPKADLPIYRGVPLWFSIIVAVLSFGGAASLPAAIIFLIFGFPFIAFYLQHEMVNRKSLPLVKKQPLKNDLQLCDCRILPKGICRNEVILALSDFSIPRQKIMKLINMALNHTSRSRE